MRLLRFIIGVCVIVVVMTPVEVKAQELSKEYSDFVEVSSIVVDIDPYIVKSLIEHESNNNPNAVNPSGTCYGLCQIHQCWAGKASKAGLGDIKTDPYANIAWCCYMLSNYYHQYYDWNKALVHYNAGHLYANSSSYSRSIIARADELRLEDYNKEIYEKYN